MAITYQTDQWVPYPIKLVFAFFANPYNLPHLMPKFLQVRIEEAQLISPPPRPIAADPALRLSSVAAGEGSRFTISARPLPLPLIHFRVPWDALIVEFQWNHHFTDEQMRGPFVSWRHTHSFAEETRANQAGVAIHGTRVGDHVEFIPPASALTGAVIRSQIARSFRDRQKKLDEILPRLVASLNRTAPSSKPI